MSHWMLAATALNVVLVAAVIVLALRIVSRGIAGPLVLPSAEPPAAAHAPAPSFGPAQMTRTEWRALLDAFATARRDYLRELAHWRGGGARAYGSLTRAKHELEVARRRLDRFERAMVRRPVA